VGGGWGCGRGAERSVKAERVSSLLVDSTTNQYEEKGALSLDIRNDPRTSIGRVEKNRG